MRLFKQALMLVLSSLTPFCSGRSKAVSFFYGTAHAARVAAEPATVDAEKAAFTLYLTAQIAFVLIAAFMIRFQYRTVAFPEDLGSLRSFGFRASGLVSAPVVFLFAFLFGSFRKQGTLT